MQKIYFLSTRFCVTLAAPKLDGTRENANSFAFPLVFV